MYTYRFRSPFIYFEVMEEKNKLKQTTTAVVFLLSFGLIAEIAALTTHLSKKDI